MAIEFEDLEVEVSHCLCGRPEVRILGSSFDRPRERFEPPRELGELNARLEELDALMLEGGRDAARRRKKLAEGIGRDLFRALLPGRVGRTFGNSLVALDTTRASHNAGLRIRLSFGDLRREEDEGFLRQVVGLPWELLCDPETMQFPGSEPLTPVVRYLDLPKRIRPLATSPPIKVLAVLSSPKDERLGPIPLAKHEEILRRAQQRQKWLKVHFLRPPTLDALREKLDRHREAGKPFHALHFLGHGDFNDEGEGVLYFQSADGGAQGVTGPQLSRQLAGFDEIRLAVLTTCVGARMMRREGQHPFTGSASALVARGIPAVLAMQFPISEEAASQFTGRFYDKLAAGRPVDEAVSEGRLRMAASDQEGSEFFEWACPVLFMRTPDGKILDIQPEDDDLPVKKIAVFNIRGHGGEEVEVNDFEVGLERYFENQRIVVPDLWSSAILEDLRKVFNRDLPEGVRYHLVFAAPISVAFAAGYLMEAKSGHQVLFSQRSLRGTTDWNLEGEVPRGASGWLAEEKAREEIPEEMPIDPDSPNVAVAVSLSRPVLPALEFYLSQAGAPRVGRVIHAVLDGEPGQSKVLDGAHALWLAEELCQRVQEHTDRHPGGAAHFFISGPNAFVFALGRLGRVFAQIQLYEFDFGGRGSGSGSYEPSIGLTPQVAG